MKKLVSRITLILLLAFVLLAGIGWFYAAQILDQLVRPQVEKIATQWLEAQLQIRQLVWTETGLAILDLRVTIPEQLQVVIPRVELKVSASLLWQRQLDALHITRPEVEINLAQNRGKSTKNSLDIPEQLPLTIKNLTIADGQLLINSADQQWRLHAFNFSGALQKNSDFSVSTFFGADENHPVASSGSVEFSRRQTLTLNSLSWQGHPLLTAPLQLNLVGSDLTLEHAVLHLEQFDHIQLRELLTALGQPSLFAKELTFLLTDARINVAWKDPAINLAVRGANGQIGWNDFSGKLTQLELLLKQQQTGWHIFGQLQGPAQSTVNVSTQVAEKNHLTGQIQVNIPDLDRFKTEIARGQALQIIGGIKLTADYSLRGDQFQLTTAIHGQSAENPSKTYRLDIGSLSGQQKLLTGGGQEEISLDLRLDSRPLLAVTGDFSRLNFSLTAADLQDVKKLLAPGQIPAPIHAFKDLQIAGQLSKKGGDWAGSLRLSTPAMSLSELTMEDVVARGTLHLSSNQISFDETSIGLTLSRGDELSTQVEIQGSGEFSAEKFSVALQQLALTQLNYMSPDGQTGVGEAVLKLQGKIHGPWQDTPLTLDLNGTFAAHEILVGEFYADLSPYQGDFSLTGTFAPELMELTASALKITIPQLAVLTATGQFRPEALRTQGHLDVADLTESYGKRIGPLLSEFEPTLAGLTLKGGMSLDYNLFRGSDAWQANGTLQLRQVAAVWDKQQLKIIDGNGVIPFAITAGQGFSGSTPDLEYPGKIAFATLSIGLATLEPQPLELTVSNNRFSFLSPLRLQFADGRVEIENLTLEWPGGKPQGSAKINIDAVDLETLTRSLGLPVLQGQLNADLGTLRYANRQFSTDGLANVEVFSGHFQLRNMRYRDPFSSYPTFYTDIDFSGLDLLQATQTFDFGEMNGLLDGHIHGLQLFGGTPAAFDAVIATQDKGKRNISVKALKNISILGQGGISAALSQGIYRFIDFYRYQKIGFNCSLNNDTFTLSGTALAGSDHYLVHGGLLPPRIDITTTTPTISFKEMQKRLGRIDRAGN